MLQTTGTTFGRSKMMTPYHTGVRSSSCADNNSIYRLIQNMPLGRNALHDIHLRFNVKDIWPVLSSTTSFKINSVSKDIRLPEWDIRGLSVKTTVHRTDTVSVVVGGSYHPIAVDFNGIIRLSNALTSVEERLSNLIQSSTSTVRQDDGTDVPDHMGWLLRCSTGSRALDELLLGGIETQAVTEFYGEFGSGKSQICHTLCATARQPIESGGMDSGVIYIDTEGTFRPERLEQIARARGLDHRDVLRSVAVCKIYNSSHLELIIKELGKYVNDFKAKLVIIDGIISLHRAEFAGRGTLADRQQRLNGMLHKIIRLAEIFNIAVVITNQVQAAPDTFFGDSTKAAGGNIIAHSSTYRIYLRKS
jgi:RecA/RadA recombinase